MESSSITTATRNFNNKRTRDDSFELESSLETKRIKENLLILDEDESDESITQDLDYIMKSFEEEISLPPRDVNNNFIVGGDTDEQPDLGFLLEASDDELGLPPCNFSSSSTSTKFGIDVENLQQQNNNINYGGEIQRFNELLSLSSCSGKLIRSCYLRRSFRLACTSSSFSSYSGGGDGGNGGGSSEGEIGAKSIVAGVEEISSLSPEVIVLDVGVSNSFKRFRYQFQRGFQFVCCCRE
ncbi:hypothetical protein MKX01_041120 [Papaver californicum]|nr:hypothetical protein MKX01_041120 [Papaver californicum]